MHQSYLLGFMQHQYWHACSGPFTGRKKRITPISFLTEREERMTITERRISIGIQLLMIIGLVMISIVEYSHVTQEVMIIRIACMGLLSLILVLYLRGFEYATTALVLSGCIIIPLVISNDTFTPSNAYAMLFPPMVAMVLTRPLWIGVTAVLTPVLLMSRPDAFLWRAELGFWILYGMLIASLVLARFLKDIN